jgi:transposase-like protein
MPYSCPLVKEIKTILIPVLCPHCQSDHIMKGGKTKAAIQRYQCLNVNCPHYSFQLDLIYKGCCPGVKERIIDRALSGATIGSAREEPACDA